MWDKPPSSWIGYLRDHSLTGFEAQLLRFRHPRFDNSAPTVDLQHLAHAVSDVQVASAVECQSARHKSSPNLLQVSFAIEYLDARVVTVGNIYSLVLTDLNGMREI